MESLLLKNVKKEIEEEKEDAIKIDECGNIERNYIKSGVQLKYGDKIEEKDILKVSKLIAKKSLRVMESEGSIYARNILEHNTDELEDIQNEIAVAIVEGGYIYNKNLYKIARKYIYHNYEKSKIELIFDEVATESDLNKLAFLKYIKDNDVIETPNKINIDDIAVTETQKKILNMYANLNNQKKVAEYLGISKQAVNKTLKKIRDNAFYCKDYLLNN